MDLSALASIRVAACDLNGQMRGKRLPAHAADKLESAGVRLPLSVLNVDLFGADIEGSPLVFESGDADGVLRPTERGAVPMPWLETPSALVPMAMYTETGAPFAGDPRHALATVLERYSANGWQVLAATEMEFTLVDASGDAPGAPVHPVTGRVIGGESVLSLSLLDAFDGFFNALESGCAAMGIPVQSTISESGVGQFEVTLTHQDAMKAADDAWLFKRLLRGVARQHGLAGTFMAKPYADDAGNGMHVHFSVLDREGRNIFDDGGPRGSDLLRAGVAGCLAAMPASTLIFAPHDNSYARMVLGAHAPTAAVWGYENRTAAIRIPGGSTAARRIEHRAAGGDTNPYLMLAAVLGAAFLGMDSAQIPPPPSTGNVYAQSDLPALAPDWTTAIAWFEADPTLSRLFDPVMIRNLVATKRQEQARFDALARNQHWLALLETV
ncbi:MAG: glutamine synthetase family protein [Sedimentitalea sp.]